MNYQLINDLKIKYRIYGLVNSFKFLLLDLHRRFFNQFIQKSFSQFKEDLIIDKLTNPRKDFFYVDVGCNDPIKFNNTYRFYLQGYHGINIDPNPSIIKRYSVVRKHDLNLNIGISDTSSQLNFYNLNPDVSSTFSYQMAQEYIKTGCRPVSQYKVPVKTLTYIFDKYLKNNQITFLSIDTEGYDLKVLKGNNWTKYRPDIILIETINNKNIANFLKSKNYRMHTSNQINSIFINV